MKGNQGLSFVSAQGLNFLAHSTMPDLILASVKVMGSWLGGDTTRHIKGSMTVTDAVNSVVFGCRGLRAM
jgi:hypothetical protein